MEAPICRLAKRYYMLQDEVLKLASAKKEKLFLCDRLPLISQAEATFDHQEVQAVTIGCWRNRAAWLEYR